MKRPGGSSQKQMTLRRHLVELRNRLFLVAGVLIVVATVAYFFRDELISTLLAPLEGRQLQYLTPGGGFKFIFSVVFFTGLAAAIPLLIYQLYAFLRPALSDSIRHKGGWLLLWSFVLLIAGIAFGYLFAVPGALQFLYGFADQYVVSALTADSYLDFVIKYTLGIGLLFQIPLIMMIIHWIKPQKPTKLLKFERWVILLAFILAAIITPTPDPVNQTIIAVPIILIYQFGVIAVCLSIWREKRNTKQPSPQATRVESEPAHPPVPPVQQILPQAPSVEMTPKSEPMRAQQTLPSIDGVIRSRHLARPIERSSTPLRQRPTVQRSSHRAVPQQREVLSQPRRENTLYIDGISPPLSAPGA